MPSTHSINRSWHSRNAVGSQQITVRCCISPVQGDDGLVLMLLLLLIRWSAATSGTCNAILRVTLVLSKPPRAQGLTGSCKVQTFCKIS